MSTVLRIILIIVSVLSFAYVMTKIRKSQLQIEDSIFWMVMAVILVIISIFPDIAYFMSDLLGIGAPVNFIFLAIIFVLLVKLFSLSIKISQLEDKIRTLAQKTAIIENDMNTKIQILEKEQAEDTKRKDTVAP